MITPNKTLKLLCIIIIIGVFSLCSIITIPASASSFKDILECRGVIEIAYDRDSLINNPIEPLKPAREIPLTIAHKVTGSYADHIVQRYLNQNSDLRNRIHIRVAEKPDWCIISAIPDFVTTDLSTNWSYTNTSLYLTLKETAPAFKKETIKIELWGDPIGKGIIYTPIHTFNITFISGFSPILKISTPQGTVQMTNPDKTAYFDVYIENYGNAKTTIFCKPLNIPKGWTVEIISNVTLGSPRFGDVDPYKTITIAIHPPVSFGYHEERETFQFSLVPTYYDNTSVKGEEIILSFIVQSEGYSSPGFEVIFLFLTIIGFIIVKKRIRKKEDN